MTLHALSLSPELCEALKAKHARFLEARLVSEAAHQDWLQSFREGYAWALSLRIRDVVDPESLTRELTRALTSTSVREVFAPVARDVHRRVLRALKASQTPLGEAVPQAARDAIDALLDRPGLVPDRVIRRIFEQDAIEAAIRMTIHDGLKEFNESVNPFFADWGLPAMFKRMPLGGTAIAKSMGALRGEFDKRLEPEILKFLKTFSRKAKARLATFFIANAGQGENATLRELRRNVVHFLYTQSLQELLEGVDEPAAGDLETAAEHVALFAIDRSGIMREPLRHALETWLTDVGDQTWGEWLAALGVQDTLALELEAWAELFWPHIQRVFGSPVAHAFFARITAEFYDALATESALEFA